MATPKSTGPGPGEGRGKLGASRPSRISEGFIEAVCERLKSNKPVRRSLPTWGRVHIDRQLPFLCIYRRPPEREDPGTDRLVVGEASYLIASGEPPLQEKLSRLLRQIIKTLSGSFGSFLVVEIWARPDDQGPAKTPPHKPIFRILEPRTGALSATVESIERGLKRITILNEPAEIEIAPASTISPPGLPPLLDRRRSRELGCHVAGIEVRPIYRDGATGKSFPLIQRRLQRGFARALKRGFFEFTRSMTTHRPPHYQALGRHSVVKAVWEIDEKLARVSSAFDFLLLLTPTNTDAAWEGFRRKRYQSEPEFSYRPIPIEPALMKRQLFMVPIERIEDPTLASLFRDQQTEIDRKISMLADRRTKAFLPGSLQLFGGEEEDQMRLAQELLSRLPAGEGSGSRKVVDAERFAALAIEEIERYRGDGPNITSTAQVRSDVSGLIVSRGNLLVGKRSLIPASRVEALLQHEVGTHLVTYLNGRAQPLRQLYVGLPGAEELQEGIAVLSEYLVGGLSHPRLRLLAARTVAVRHMIDGASFVDLFRELWREHGFDARTAFTTCMRVLRSGGLTKDAVYLRGLNRVLDYIRMGNELEPLLVGKIGVDQIPIVNELRWRKVLKPPPLLPRYLADERCLERLRRIRTGRSILELMTEKKP